MEGSRSAIFTYGSPGMAAAGKKALVVEGGGMRGVFAAGVLDAFLKQGFNPFDILIGVSSGAVCLASYMSGQYRRYYRITTGPMSTGNFLSLRRFMTGGHLMDLDWLWKYSDEHDPLDIAAATSHEGKEYLVGVTDVETAEPVFLEPGQETLSDYLKASCALPIIYRGFARADGRLVADGGVADPIPVREVYRRGARFISVIRTRAPESPKKGYLLDCLVSALFIRGHARLKERIRDLRNQYRDAVAFIHEPPDDALMVEIAPPDGLRGARLSMDLEGMKADYELGIQAGEEYLSLYA